MSKITKHSLVFVPTLAEFLKLRSDHGITVLSGGNNMGKSVTLKWLKKEFGRTAYYVGTSRFYHVYHFSTGMRNPREVDEWENQFRNNFDQEQYNYEQNFIDLGRIILNLGDKKGMNFLIFVVNF